jgi:hypothetical protein
MCEMAFPQEREAPCGQKGEKHMSNLCKDEDGVRLSAYLFKSRRKKSITFSRFIHPIYRHSTDRQTPCHNPLPFNSPFVSARIYNHNHVSSAIYLGWCRKVAASGLPHFLRDFRFLLRSSNVSKYFKP